MKRYNRKTTTILTLFVILCLVGLPLLYYAGRPLPIQMRRDLHPGVTYYRRVRITPRLAIVHIVRIDLQIPGIDFLVTPGDARSERPLKAMKTSRFLDKYNVQIAINGGGFTPWYFNNFLDYYPHEDDPVSPNGFAASKGKVYATGDGPTLYISKTNQVSIGEPIGKIFNAISGDRMLVENGEPVVGLNDARVDPRTAVGLSANRQVMVLVVVDGRQPLYSHGLTLLELAEILIYYGASTAMSLDGGGSSTLVFEGRYGPRVVNSPIEAYIPGLERAVGNHLGIFIP